MAIGERDWRLRQFGDGAFGAGERDARRLIRGARVHDLRARGVDAKERGDDIGVAGHPRGEALPRLIKLLLRERQALFCGGEHLPRGVQIEQCGAYLDGGLRLEVATPHIRLAHLRPLLLDASFATEPVKQRH